VIVGIAAVEAVLLAFYLYWDASFHWLLHLLVGGSIGLLAATAGAAPRGLRTGALVPVVTVGHLIAAVPDILFRLGVPHQHWMDLFAWHLESHFAPGGLLTWYLVFLVCLGANLLLQYRRRSWPVVAALVSAGTALALAHERVPTELTSTDHAAHLAVLLSLPLAAIALVRTGCALRRAVPPRPNRPGFHDHWSRRNILRLRSRSGDSAGRAS
jgi:hypothetical protein